MTASDLQTLLASMAPVQRDGEFVYVAWPDGTPLPATVEAVVREDEGLTVVLARATADRLGLDYSYVAAWLTLGVHSELDAVGLTAAFGTALAEARISCNVLAGFHHDHLLVPVADAPRALEVLHELSAESRQAPHRELELRAETAADREAILGVVAAAFAISPVTGLPVDGEPTEVAVLRGLFDADEYLPDLSVVALLDGEVVGHCISTRGWAGEHQLLGLGPVAVVPRLQQHGIGSALINESIVRANAAGECGIALLGSPDYYARFGFVPAANFGVMAPDPAWGEHFQLLPLALWPGGVHGTFRYAAAFGVA